MPRILVVEDDPAFANRLARNLGLDGFEADVAEGPEVALRRLAGERFDGVVCDIRMPGMSGLELLERVRRGGETGIDPELPFLMLTSVNSVETAVEAMRLGASDYLTKEAGRPEVVVRLRKALAEHALSQENRHLREAVARADEFGELVGASDAMKRIKQDIAEVASTNATVMLLGETGSGKELVARAIHRASGRAGAFVDLNGAMLPDDTMLQSELFGHEKGSFTDAKALKKGKLELADGGTLFIDEVGEVSREVQAKLLRVLETMTFTRVGGTREITVDVRVVVATNRDLLREVEAGRFRDDLYYRLNVFPIEIPPLRARREDIPSLARFFLARTAERYGRPLPELQAEAFEALQACHWPGNIRELRNICERLLIRARGGTVLTAQDVRACGLGPASEVARVVSIPEEGIDLDDLEKNLVLEALRRTDWNQTEAARLLGISVDRMNNRVKKYGFTHAKWRINRGQP
ncbi:MAG: sigma-54-dependent Fis family transcriptional regulator [Candidatus Sumerlaeia bacterium]|nr:sigma-54-dependent Fis family transcriptional regulator [Candidatus Sumerlaeia bacterium]